MLRTTPKKREDNLYFKDTRCDADLGDKKIDICF